MVIDTCNVRHVWNPEKVSLNTQHCAFVVESMADMNNMLHRTDSNVNIASFQREHHEVMFTTHTLPGK